MTTVVNSVNGKETLQKDYFDWMKEEENQQIKPKLNRLVYLMKQYRQEDFGRYNDWDDFTDPVYWLLKGKNGFELKMDILNLIQKMANYNYGKSEKDRLSDFDVKQTLDTLHSLFMFFERLSCPSSIFKLQEYDILESPPDDVEEIDRLIVEFEERLKSAKAGIKTAC